MIKLRWFWFVCKKILPTGEYSEELLKHTCFYPRRLLYHSTAKPSSSKGLTGVNVTCRSHQGAEAHAGAFILQLYHIDSTSRNQLCQLLSQLQGQGTVRELDRAWLLQALPQALPQFREQHVQSFLSKSVLVPKYFTLQVRQLSLTAA